MEIINIGRGALLPPENWSMYDLLEQGELWRGADGTWHRLKDMRPEHRLNVSKFLMRRACNLKIRYEIAMLRFMGDTFDGGLDVIDFSDEENPTVWLTERPLYRALLAGLPEGGAALAALRRRAAHHSNCQHSKPVEQRTHGASCTCRGSTPKGSDDVAAG